MLEPDSSIRYFTTAGVGSGIAAHAASYGIDIIPICHALDIDPSAFGDMTKRISLDKMCRLFEACAVISGDEAFGLKAVKTYIAGSTGPYGYGLMAAPDVESFIKFLHRHRMTVSHTVNSNLIQDAEGIETTWSYSPLIIKRDQYVDLGMALVMARLKPFLGEDSSRIEISLERPKPANPAPFRALLSRKIKFGCAVNAVRIPQDLLRRANPSGDAKLFQLMEMQCETMTPTHYGEADFRDELRDYILAHINEANIGLDDVARYFHLSERTLQRRLAERQTTLNDLRDDVRKELAARLLTESDLTLAEIAIRLGYSASSAFSRSMVRWYGVNPSDYRQSHTK